MATPLHLNSSNFNATISGATPVLVDFWAPWCGPCKMLSPTIDALANEITTDKAIIAKVNVDESPDLASQFNVSQIPTIIFFKNSKEVGRSGMATKDALAKILSEI